MPTALVIDDEPGIREVFEAFLTLQGYTVCTAADGIEGLKQLETERPEVVLLDNQMPRLTGLEMLRQMRHATSKIAVILISGALDADTRETARALGAVACLQKPVGLLQLEQCLVDHAQGRAAAREGQGPCTM